jgi:hypothetical protein
MDAGMTYLPKVKLLTYHERLASPREMKDRSRADKATAASAKAFKGGCAVAYPPYPTVGMTHLPKVKLLTYHERLASTREMKDRSRADKATAASAKTFKGGCAALIHIWTPPQLQAKIA